MEMYLRLVMDGGWMLGRGSCMLTFLRQVIDKVGSWGGGNYWYKGWPNKELVPSNFVPLTFQLHVAETEHKAMIIRPHSN